ncbi:Drug/Metabolite transporter (DMT) Superfamily [Phytophthora palmivora]|uniref:Drug/Metabolite transporter (DMT) Superfamily n=1 Tax=Phytophthora palmivora TaxID=4796 RepID=A0A2P4XXU7_9STRA|nr:Drug/Metabolite transporter (DMT) Superfamily [Phytophthora palmivora]
MKLTIPFVPLVLIWVGVTQAEAAQALQATTHFRKPFFITCLDHAITALLLPGLYIYHRVGDASAGVQTDKLGIVDVLQRHSMHPLRKLLTIAVVLNSVYLLADYMWFTALGMVSVAAGTAISNTAPFFVYVFSMCFLHEKASWKKLSGVVTSFIGVALIALFQDGVTENSHDTSFLACMLVVTQTMIVAGYGVTYRVVVSQDVDDASTILTLTGICGMVTIPVWVVGSLLLSVCPLQAMEEPLGLPETEWGFFLLIVSGSLAGIYTLLQSLALCWTTPLITSVGAMLTIPLSLLWDTILNGRVFAWECLLGSTLVMAGFGMLELGSSKQKAEDKIEATIA